MKDDRDPLLLGVELLRARERAGSAPLHEVADRAALDVPGHGTAEARDALARLNGEVDRLARFPRRAG